MGTNGATTHEISRARAGKARGTSRGTCIIHHGESTKPK